MIDSFKMMLMQEGFVGRYPLNRMPGEGLSDQKLPAPDVPSVGSLDNHQARTYSFHYIRHRNGDPGAQHRALTSALQYDPLHPSVLKSHQLI